MSKAKIKSRCRRNPVGEPLPPRCILHVSEKPFMRSRLLFLLAILLAILTGANQISTAQENPGNSNWTSSSQQQDPNGAINPIRAREVHSETGGRTVDRQSLEIVGPDGQYVPYRDTETESVRVDPTTVRTIQRTYGRGPDGQRTLVQVQQEDTRTLPGGDQHVVRTFSSPDANGNLQVARRELEDSKDVFICSRHQKNGADTRCERGFHSCNKNGRAPNEVRRWHSPIQTIDFAL